MRNLTHKILRNRLTIPLTPFYRQFPYRGHVSINSADDRGCVDPALGFFCNRIPKAANSTVVTNLAKLKYGDDVPSKEAKKLFKTPSQLSRQEVTALSDWFRFAVVRNPYSRTLSAYLDKVERRALRAGKESSFKGFLLELKDGALYSNAHWAPQSDLLLLPVEKFDFFGKVESLDQDLVVIRNRIQGTEEEEGFKSFLDNATGASKKMDQYYDPECVDLVKQLFAADFDTFGYSTEFPSATA